jgi:hypothetical protein
MGNIIRAGTQSTPASRMETSSMKTALKKPKLIPTLRERIDALHEEIEMLIEIRVDEIARTCPGVHRLGIRQRIENRTHGCKCAVARLINEGKA